MHIYRYICLLTVLFCGWYARYAMVLHSFEHLPLEKTVRIRGSVTSHPYNNGSKQIIRIGQFRVATAYFPAYIYGDSVEVIGRLEKRVTKSGKPEIWLMNPTVRAIENRASFGNSPIYQILIWISNLRLKVLRSFSYFLPEPQGSLLTGILLGARRRMPEDFSEALRRTGTMHVIVASGYNVTVVAALLASLLLRFLSRRLAIPFIILGVVFYISLSGAEPPVVRAGIMGSLTFLAQFLGRPYHGLWALCLTSFSMLLVSPILLFDVGFQLSVAATLGILVGTPILKRFIDTLPHFRGKEGSEALAVTIGAQVAVLPLLLHYFESVSLISPLTNLLIFWLVPIIMFLGGIGAVAAFVSSRIAYLASLLSWVPLTAFVGIVTWFDRLPFASFEVRGFSFPWVLGSYLILVFIIIRWRRKPAMLFQEQSGHSSGEEISL